MTTHHITHVRKVPANGHDHVTAVRTLNGDEFSTEYVLQTLGGSDHWFTLDVGAAVSTGRCEFGCSGPYIWSESDSYGRGRLDDLPSF